MKAIYMRTKYARASKPMHACFGVTIDTADRVVSTTANVATIEAGWVTLEFGRDATWTEFMLATTRHGSLLFSVEPPDGPPWDSRGCTDWVTTINYFPTEVFDGANPPTEFFYGGFRVVHAADRRRRHFIFVEMPGGKISLLFRNLSSSTAMAWRPRRTPTVDHVVAIQADLQMPLREVAAISESTGDTGLDALLLAFD